MTNNTDNLLLKNTCSDRNSPWEKLLPACFSEIEGGQLTLILPDDHVLKLGHANADSPHAVIKLNSFKPLSVLFAKGDLAFAECYLRGEWECPD